MRGLETPIPLHLPFTLSPEMPSPAGDHLSGVMTAMWESLVNRLSSVESALQSLTQTHVNLAHAHETLAIRHRELSAAHDQIVKEARERPESPLSSDRISEPKIPDPPLYNGDRKELLIWLMKCQMKFEGQPSKFKDLRTKMIYVGTCLDGPAFAWFQPMMEKWPLGTPATEDSIPTAFKSWDDFKKAITIVFGDPNLSATAERELRSLHQLKSVAEYAAQFEAKRQYLAWNDAAFRDQFYLGLKEEVKDQIAPIGKPADLAGLKELAIRLDARLFERRLEQRGPSSSNQYKITAAATPRSYPAPAAAVPPPGGSPTWAPVATPRPGPTVSADGTIPMELDASGVYRLPVKEKQRRRQLGLCDYCAANNHLWRNCPVRPQFCNPPRGQGVMSFEFSAPAEAQWEKGETEE